MRKLTFFRNLLLLALTLGIVALPFGAYSQVGDPAPVDDTTIVNWTIGGCWVDFSVHADVDLGVTTGTDEVLEETGNQMTVKTNCRGVDVEVEAVEAGTSTPAGFTGNLLEDFEWRAETSSAVFTLDGSAGSYGNFTSFGSGSSQLVGSTPNAANFTFTTDYRYTTDFEDVPGNYQVELMYTVSAN
ncbi:hypothetical protein KGY79_13075 [Candidatus Bipolaricaulota bacterium]|nr:hypothetical protein [Candidatus Bipolaricaulota bacterium]